MRMLRQTIAAIISLLGLTLVTSVAWGAERVVRFVPQLELTDLSPFNVSFEVDPGTGTMDRRS
jgi:hypothetical protein